MWPLEEGGQLRSARSQGSPLFFLPADMMDEPIPPSIPILRLSISSNREVSSDMLVELGLTKFELPAVITAVLDSIQNLADLREPPEEMFPTHVQQVNFLFDALERLPPADRVQSMAECQQKLQLWARPLNAWSSKSFKSVNKLYIHS